MEKEVGFENQNLAAPDKENGCWFYFICSCTNVLLKRITFFSLFPAIKLGKINNTVMQERNDAIKHAVNTKKRNPPHYLILCFAVLLRLCSKC